jgi:hypothetical protein
LLASAVLASAAQTPAHSGQRGAVKREPVIESLTGFSIVLVLGETQPSGSGGAETLPGAAKKALNDMREFLPYKNYRVLDAQWMSCCAPGPTTVVAGRLQGVVVSGGANGGSVNLVPRAHAFRIVASSSMANIPVRFILTLDGPDAQKSAQGVMQARERELQRQDVEAEMQAMSRQIRDTQERIDVGLIPKSELAPLQDRLNALQRKLSSLTLRETLEDSASHGDRPIIDGSFTMDAGETVVVGTSKLGGDKALIAIVTAVKKAGGSR